MTTFGWGLMSGEDSFWDSYHMDSFKLFGLAWLLSGNRSTSHDLVAETITKALLQLRKGKAPDGELLPWLCRICINTFKDQQRKGRTADKYAHYLLSDESANHCQSCGMGPCSEQEFRTCWNSLENRIRALPQVQAKCLLLRVRGFSYREIGEHVHIETKAVKCAIENGMCTLRKHFHCAGCP